MVNARCIDESGESLLVRPEGSAETVWILKSQIGPFSKVNRPGDVGPLQIPEGLAWEKEIAPSSLIPKIAQCDMCGAWQEVRAFPFRPGIGFAPPEGPEPTWLLRAQLPRSRDRYDHTGFVACPTCQKELRERDLARAKRTP